MITERMNDAALMLAVLGLGGILSGVLDHVWIRRRRPVPLDTQTEDSVARARWVAWYNHQRRRTSAY